MPDPVSRLQFAQQEIDRSALQSWHHVVKTRESGIMALAMFKLIRSCLHPDSRNSVSIEKLNKAFRVFNRLQHVLCDEAEMPTKNYAFTSKEWTWMRGRREREKARAKAARRNAKKSDRPANRRTLDQSRC